MRYDTRPTIRSMIDRSFHAHNKELGSAVLFYVAGIALLTLLVKSMIEWRQARQQATPALQTDSH